VCIASIPVPESSGNVSLRMDGGEKSIDASFVPTSDLLGVSGAEKLKIKQKIIFSHVYEKKLTDNTREDRRHYQICRLLAVIFEMEGHVEIAKTNYTRVSLTAIPVSKTPGLVIYYPLKRFICSSTFFLISALQVYPEFQCQPG
jgi:hypothetical protein